MTFELKVHQVVDRVCTETMQGNEQVGKKYSEAFLYLPKPAEVSKKCITVT